LSALAGSVEAAEKLYDLAEDYQEAEDSNNPGDLEKLGNELDTALERARGDIIRILRESQSYAFEKATLAKATGERFDSQLKAYRAAEDIYKRMLRLNMLEEALKNIRKYVVVADPNDKQIIIIDLQGKLTPSLYDIGGFEESSEK
jgi:tetratricopeptide (TPR) repeat protein